MNAFLYWKTVKDCVGLNNGVQFNKRNVWG